MKFIGTHPVGATMKVVYNAQHGGYGLSDEARKWLEGRGVWDLTRMDRHDPLLVECVETLGRKAATMFCTPTIAEITGSLYRITEYDGLEAVETPDSIDWVDGSAPCRVPITVAGALSITTGVAMSADFGIIREVFCAMLGSDDVGPIGCTTAAPRVRTALMTQHPWLPGTCKADATSAADLLDATVAKRGETIMVRPLVQR